MSGDRNFGRSATIVSVSPKKTLAKLANHFAKKNPEIGGVCELIKSVAYDHWMAQNPPEDI